MMSELGRGHIMNEGSFGDDLEKELGLLLHEQRKDDNDNDRENELNMYRSGSAPPSVEGSLSAVSGLFGNNNNNGNRNNNLSFSEDELRADPAYAAYYYSNVNLNPRLPPPLSSKEDWRFSQRLQSGGGGGGGGGMGLGGIGDRWKASRTDDGGGGGGGRSLFAMPPGFNSKKQEVEKFEAEWGGDGLIGLPGLGLGSKQKSFAEFLQDDLSCSTPPSSHPSRPASRTAFENNDENTGPSLPTSYSYAAALAASLSRSGTPDPQHIARVPSPIPTPIGVNRVNSNSQTHFNTTSSHSNESKDLTTAFSGMNLSNGTKSRKFDQNGSSNNLYSNWDPSYSNYNTGTYSGQGGNLNLPPLFENAAAAASAMAYPGMESRFGMESQSPSRMTSQIAGNASFIDPVYLQYLRNTEYAAQLAALTDPSMDRNSYLGNSYTDLLQKAYLGSLSSPKSQYNSPNHHGFYGNPNHGYGMGLSYPGSPLMGPLPNSPRGPGSPIRLAELNSRFSPQMRNLGGGGGGIMSPCMV